MKKDKRTPTSQLLQPMPSPTKTRKQRNPVQPNLALLARSRAAKKGV